MSNFNETYLKIISESRIVISNLKAISRNKPNIDEVKKELLKLFKFNSWEDFVSSQSAGQCDFISKVVCRLFPKFKMVSVYAYFSPEAKKKIGNDGSTYATHFLNKLGNTYYDFGKGTNRYDGVYVLEGLGNIYDVNVSEEERKQLQQEQEEDPKAIGTTIRE